MRAAKGEKENTRERSKLLVSQASEDKGAVGEARERERKSRAEAVGGINE